MPINSRSKGQRGERDLAKVLTEAGFESKRGATQSAGAITADVVGLPGHWCEAKFHKDHAAIRFLDQAKRDAKIKGDGDIPIALLKENGSKWHALLDLGVYLGLLRLALKCADGHCLNLGDLVEQPSRPVKVKSSKGVAGKELSTKKSK